ncbi:serine hydroxymethyltransferase [Hutsoniella sourekii]
MAQFFDQEIFDLIELEKQRQEDNIELIASENFTSEEVRLANGSILTHKYAEGYPNKRYYGGCEYIDQIEQLAIDRAKELFGAEYVNVQPHSGSQANMAVFRAMLNHGDKYMGLDLDHGGHLTHGSPANFSGKDYQVISYQLDAESETLDYDAIQDLAVAEQPKLIIAGYTAYPRAIDFKRFREIADACGAILWVDMAHIAGLVAGGSHISPIPYADIVTTTTHKTLRGPRGGMILAKEAYAKKLNSVVFPGSQGGPLEHVIAAKAICLKEALEEDFTNYAHQVVANAKAMADVFKDSPARMVSGGTDNHLLLIDVSDFDLTGKQAEELLDEVKITVNKNTVPFDKRSPFVTSGIRIGTPAITTRGFDEEACREVARLIIRTLEAKEDSEKRKQITQEVLSLTAKYPLY